MPKRIYFRAFCAFRYGEMPFNVGENKKGSYPRGRLPSLTRLRMIYEKFCMLKATAVNVPNLFIRRPYSFSVRSLDPAAPS